MRGGLPSTPRRHSLCSGDPLGRQKGRLWKATGVAHDLLVKVGWSKAGHLMSCQVPCPYALGGVKQTVDELVGFVLWTNHGCGVTRWDREVVNFKRYHVKNYSKLTNFRKFTRIEGYNGKYGSNPQGIKEFLDVFFKFEQIGREIDDRNWGKWYFMKVDFKSIRRNQKSSTSDLISRRNHELKWREISERRNRDFRGNLTKLKLKSYSKQKLNMIRR